MQLLGGGSRGSGLGGLVQALQKNGLGDVVSSWISTGQNLPISAEQIQRGLGQDFFSNSPTLPGCLRKVPAPSWPRSCRAWSTN
jgi:uncharacterized protein YidB (DUF937 family)